MLTRVCSALLWVQVAVLVVGPCALAQNVPKLSIKLERVQSSIAGDRNVQIRAEIRNISQTEVRLMLSAPETEFTLQVTGPDGKAALATERGQKLRSVVPNGSHVLVTLPPQEVISRIWTLSDLVDFSRPGKYRVIVSRYFDTINETDTSNAIDVSIP